MAHELNFTNGRADYFGVGETAWHREGTTFPEGTVLSLDDAMAVANLGYTVDIQPAYQRMATPDGDEYYRASETGRIVVRTDTMAELGVVGTRYEVLQNGDAFRALEPLIDTGLAVIETGGVLRGGADAWLLVRWALEKMSEPAREWFTREGVKPYAVVAANHNGRRGATAMMTAVRIVCANTLGLAERQRGQGESITIRHSGNTAAKMVQAASSLFAGVIASSDAAVAQYAQLQATILDAKAFKALVLDVVAPDPREAKGFDPRSKRADNTVERYAAKAAEVTRLWTEGKGHTGDHSAYEAYNAVVEALDHDAAGLFPVRGGTGRVSALLDGSLHAAKATVMRNLLGAGGAQ